MANVTYGDGLGEFGLPQYFYNGKLQPHKFFTKGPHHTIVGVEYIDATTHSTIDIRGTHLKFNGSHPTAGSVTSITFKSSNTDPSHRLLMTIDTSDDHVHLSAKTLYQKATHHQLDQVITMELAHNNTITGSHNGDYILSGTGNDVLKGGDGDDWITGGGGTNKLYGGGKDGALDVFWFGHGQGHDTVYDYETGVDQIGLLTTDHLYHYDVGDDVVLQFEKSKNPDHPLAHPATDTMVIKHAHFADLDFYALM